MTATLRMRFTTTSYDEWKAVFDSDPMDRKGSGVTAHRILQSVDDPHDVSVDLVFGSAQEAQAFRTRLEAFWATGQAMIGEDTNVVVALNVEEG